MPVIKPKLPHVLGSWKPALSRPHETGTTTAPPVYMGLTPGARIRTRKEVFSLYKRKRQPNVQDLKQRKTKTKYKKMHQGISRVLSQALPKDDSMDLRSDSLATFTIDVCRIGLISSSNAPWVTRVPRMSSPHKKEVYEKDEENLHKEGRGKRTEVVGDWRISSQREKKVDGRRK